MKITIMGGGNIGSLMAAEMAYKGHEVTLYTSKPKQWKNWISVYDIKDNLLLEGELANITNDLKEAIEFADMLFVTMPSQTFSQLAKDIAPYVNAGQMIGIIPGSGGAEFAFSGLINKGCLLFGFQRVHSIARLKEYGKSVYMLGRKTEIQLGAIPAGITEHLCGLVESLLDMPCIALPNYLCVTLTPSNPILHTTRIYAMFQDYKVGVVYPRNFLFYEEWDDFSSEMLIKCDSELQQLCKVIPLELDDVKSLQQHYESYTVKDMTQKISGISAFKGLFSPMTKCDEGWVPDFESRYFTADFPYGLKVIKDIGTVFNVKMPEIDKVWKWYELVNYKEDTTEFELNIGINEFINLYS